MVGGGKGEGDKRGRKGHHGSRGGAQGVRGTEVLQEQIVYVRFQNLAIYIHIYIYTDVNLYIYIYICIDVVMCLPPSAAESSAGLSAPSCPHSRSEQREKDKRLEGWARTAGGNTKCFKSKSYIYCFKSFPNRNKSYPNSNISPILLFTSVCSFGLRCPMVGNKSMHTIGCMCFMVLVVP